MGPAEIQYRLKKKNVTQTSIADALGVTQAAVSLVVAKKSRSSRIMKAISDAIGEDPKYVFSEFYYKSPKKPS